MTTHRPIDAEAREAPRTPRLSPDTLAAARAVTAHHALRVAAWQASAFATEQTDAADDANIESTPPPV